MKHRVALIAFAFVAVSCGTTDSVAPEVGSTAEDCDGRFVAQDLEHVTSGPTRSTTMFDGTGSGIAAGDIDGDGRTDLVVANLSGESSVFWNLGSFEFERQPLAVGRFRHPAIVDVDGDGNKDIVMTTGVGVPVVLTSTGEGASRPDFVPSPISGVDGVAYSMAWGDLGGDGDLDLVTGSYNAELTQSREFAPLLGGRTGVFVYDSFDGRFEKERLTANAQALVVRIQDLNADGRQDILVGNDLITPDASFLAGDAWVPADVFPETTFSTMSFDAGDVDNDGDADLFATDMHPMSDDPDVLAQWEPIMEDMEAQPAAPGNQKMENVLLRAGDQGSFENSATDMGVTFTGWSWSGLFGDLDNDGNLDIYVVNGMAADSLFPDLPGNALVEENQAFKNAGDGSMQPAPEWGLADTAGGRGMIMDDLDGDGDLDIAINNLNAPTRLFENRLCGGNGVVVELDWEGTANRAAVGAEIRASTDNGLQLMRTVDITRGYLSSGPDRVHFGVGDASEMSIRVVWPDGVITTTEATVDDVVRIVRDP